MTDLDVQKIQEITKAYSSDTSQVSYCLAVANYILHWKQEQMIEKAVAWLEPIFKDLAGYNCGGDLINDFKKAMEN